MKIRTLTAYDDSVVRLPKGVELEVIRITCYGDNSIAWVIKEGEIYEYAQPVIVSFITNFCERI